MAFGKSTETVNIEPAKITRTTFRVVGTAPYVQNKFSNKAKQKMKDTQRAGSQGKANKKRDARDFDGDFKAAQHVSEEGWYGIPAPAFRAAMIDACRTVGLAMTRAKMAVFIVADGLDADDGTPLVKLIAEEPEMHEACVRNKTGVPDIRVRPMWRRWGADVTLDFDEEILSSDNVANLLDRAGRQVGIGEGRPFSKDSVGQGWGTFIVAGKKEE